MILVRAPSEISRKLGLELGVIGQTQETDGNHQIHYETFMTAEQGSTTIHGDLVISGKSIHSGGNDAALQMKKISTMEQYIWSDTVGMVQDRQLRQLHSSFAM